MGWLWVLAGLAVVAAALYWQLILAEGAYLGRRVVALLYDGSAHVYDRIKGFDPGYEQWFLGLPLSRALATLRDPLILDVATGTGRLARTLFPQSGFRGRMIGLDLSRKMLVQAQATTRPWAERITYLLQGASRLPFPDDTFDTVACLEALEFLPDPDQTLAELHRVLRPGGVFLITNRIGPGARWMPGRTFTSEAFKEKLHALPLEMVRHQPWQEDYDLFWAVKPGVMGPVGMRRLAEILRCPRCDGALEREGDAFRCAAGHQFPIEGNLVEMQR